MMGNTVAASLQLAVSRPRSRGIQSRSSGRCGGRQAVGVRCSAAAAVPAAAVARRGVRLAGSGSAVPEKFLTNHDLSKLVETNDEWITSRTGIKKRHVLSEGESLSDLAAKAGREALDMAGGCRGQPLVVGVSGMLVVVVVVVLLLLAWRGLAGSQLGSPALALLGHGRVMHAFVISKIDLWVCFWPAMSCMAVLAPAAWVLLLPPAPACRAECIG